MPSIRLELFLCALPHRLVHDRQKYCFQYFFQLVSQAVKPFSCCSGVNPSSTIKRFIRSYRTSVYDYSWFGISGVFGAQTGAKSMNNRFFCSLSSLVKLTVRGLRYVIEKRKRPALY